MKDHERRWQRAAHGGWRTVPGPNGLVIEVSSTGEITLKPRIRVSLNVGGTRWMSLRLAEAAVLSELTTPEAPQTMLAIDMPDPPSSFYEAKRRYFGLDEERNVPQ